MWIKYQVFKYFWGQFFLSVCLSEELLCHTTPQKKPCVVFLLHRSTGMSFNRPVKYLCVTEHRAWRKWCHSWWFIMSDTNVVSVLSLTLHIFPFFLHCLKNPIVIYYNYMWPWTTKIGHKGQFFKSRFIHHKQLNK